MKSETCRAAAQRGFSLLEVLVAFSIFSVLMGIVLHIFSSGVTMAAVSDEYTRATQLAESRLATVGVENELEVGETFGEADDRYRWHVAINLYRPAIEGVDLELLPVEVYRVDVTVEWGDVGEERSVVLTTLRLGPRNL